MTTIPKTFIRPAEVVVSIDVHPASSMIGK